MAFNSLQGLLPQQPNPYAPRNPLMDLVLGQTQVGDPEPAPMAGTIEVTGQRPSNGGVPNVDIYGEDVEFPGNRNVLEEAQYSMEQAPERKGMFGMKGTLRDILGTVGDAFLIGTGRNAIYTPGREREKMGDAMAGFTGSPESVRASAERLAALGYVDEAQKLIQQYEQQQLRNAQLESLEASRASQASDRAAGNFTDAMDRIGRAFATDAPPELKLEFAGRIAQAYGTSLEELGIRPDITPEEMAMIAGSDMTVNQQRNFPLAERRVATGEYNAQTGRINANRPRRGPQPRNPTEASELARIRNRLNNGEPLSEGDKATWERYQNGTRGGSGNGRRQVTPPSNSRFRIIRD